MEETEELIRLSVRALAAQMIAAPGVELHMTPACILGLTDEPLADFNRLILGTDPDAEGFLVRSAARAKERGRPLSAVMSPRAAETLAPAATRLGFAAVGTAPLMVLRPDVAVRPGRPIRIARALGPDLVGVAGDLIAAAFDEPRDVIARCIDVGMTPTAGVETYVGWGDDAPLCTVSVTPTGDTAGISLMATPPEHQRQGLGRALLSQVINDYRRRGVTRFHLGATEAGRPLYASLASRSSPTCRRGSWKGRRRGISGPSASISDVHYGSGIASCLAAKPTSPSGSKRTQLTTGRGGIADMSPRSDSGRWLTPLRCLA